MGRIIPNEQTWVGFATSVATLTAPTEAEINGAIDITPLLMSLNASAQGNQVPTPSLDTLFETSIVGTSQATFTADFYRDDVSDAAWDLLPRGTKGVFIISRFGGSGLDQIPRNGDSVECWQVEVVSRVAANMQNNTVQTFSITCAVNVVPAEDAMVTSASAVPSVPLNPVAVALTATTAQVDFDAPNYVGAGLTSPFYAVYRDSSSGGTFTTLCTATIAGTVATVTGLTTATQYYFKVVAHNAAGDSAKSAVSNAITTP
jgi:hypothetical protein